MDEYTNEEKRAALNVAYDTVLELVAVLEIAKPNNRSKQDNLTDAQKLLAWIKTYCME